MFLLVTNFVIRAEVFKTASAIITFLKVSTCFFNPVIYSGFTFELYLSQILPFFKNAANCKSTEEESQYTGVSRNLEITSTSLFQRVQQTSQSYKQNLLLVVSSSMIIFLLFLLAVLTLTPFHHLHRVSWPWGTAVLVLGGANKDGSVVDKVDIISPDEERLRTCSMPNIPFISCWNFNTLVYCRNICM